MSTASECELAEAATGCRGAGSFRRWAREQGYPRCEVFDWSSSAGDWTFIVSVDGVEWFVMWQTNRWPYDGFERHIGKEPRYGTAEEVLQQLVDLYV